MVQKFVTLSFWEKVGAIGSIASIASILLYVFNAKEQSEPQQAERDGGHIVNSQGQSETKLNALNSSIQANNAIVGVEGKIVINHVVSASKQRATTNENHSGQQLEGSPVAAIDLTERLEKSKTIQVRRIPSNIASLDHGSSIQRDYNSIPYDDDDLNLKVIIDDDINTMLRISKYKMEKLRYIVEFPKEYSVGYISFYQPENKQSLHYLKEVSLKGVYPNGTYSESVSVALGRDQGFVGQRLEFKAPIKAILVNPHDSYSYRDVILGDIRVYTKE